MTNKVLTRKNRKICKKLTSLLFSQVGLLILVIVYMIAGSFLFQLLEEHARVQLCEEGAGIDTKLMFKYRNKLFQYISVNITYNEIDAENATNNTLSGYNDVIEDILKNMRDEIIKLQDEFRYYGQDCLLDTSWKFESSFLFAVSLITTIGYGHVSPITWEGQIVCICYSLIGIPFFLLNIANISKALGNSFRFICFKVIQLVAFRKKSNSKKSISVVSTIQTVESYSYNENAESSNKTKEIQEQRHSLTNMTIPFILVISIISLYIFAGAYLFSYLEEWSTLSSSYFAFVTLATIGFGDYLPGKNAISENDTSKSQRNLILCTFYIFIGMSILAMCFDLIQKSWWKNFKWISNKIGMNDIIQSETTNVEYKSLDSSAHTKTNNVQSHVIFARVNERPQYYTSTTKTKLLKKAILMNMNQKPDKSKRNKINN